MTSTALRADLAVSGVGVTAPVHRRGGAGPSDDRHVLLGGVGTALPIVATSKYQVHDGRLLLDGADLGLSVAPVGRPAFYDLRTADGAPYEQIARLHGKDVLATTVVQTCIRYDAAQRCRFCAIEESLRAGSTTAVKTPSQLAEVASAAVRLKGCGRWCSPPGPRPAATGAHGTSPGVCTPSTSRCPSWPSRYSASRPPTSLS